MKQKSKIADKIYYIGLIVLLLILGFANYYRKQIGFDPMNIFSGISDLVSAHKMDLLLSQIASSFLVISLLTVLSNKGESILWVNIIEYKLIRPRRKSFKDITGYCFFALIFSFVAMLPMIPSWVLLYFFLWNVVFLMWMTIKMIEVFYDVKGIDKQLQKEYFQSGFEVKREYLEKLTQNTIQCLERKESDKFKENIGFMHNAYHQADEEEKNLIAGKMEYILKNVSPTDAWAYIYILKLFSGTVEAEETINSFLKRLIHDNLGTAYERRELIDWLFKDLHEEMTQYFEEEIWAICYVVASANSRYEGQKRETELRFKTKNKYIDLLQYAYFMGDIETVESIVRGFNDIWRKAYDKLEQYIDDNKLNYLVDVTQASLELPSDIFNEDEKAVVSAIIEREEQSPILYPRIVKMMKAVFLQEWFTEPSEEELEIALYQSTKGK